MIRIYDLYKIYAFILIFISVVFSQENGFSYWWYSDELIDYSQMRELDDLSGDQELWCALAELYVGKELAEEANCEFEEEQAGKKKVKKRWNLNLTTGTNLDTNGNLKNEFAKVNGKYWDFSATVQMKNNVKANAAYKYKMLHLKGGDLTSKYRGILSEFTFSDLTFGVQRLFKEEKDSVWFYSKFNKNYKIVYAGANMKYNDEQIYSRTWQGIRFWQLNFKMTEVYQKENLDFRFLLERKKKNTRIAVEHDKNKSSLSANYNKFSGKITYPLTTRIGYDMFSLYWKENKPFEVRCNTKMKFPIWKEPVLTFRWTIDQNVKLKQLYLDMVFNLG